MSVEKNNQNGKESEYLKDKENAIGKIARMFRMGRVADFAELVDFLYPKVISDFHKKNSEYVESYEKEHEKKMTSDVVIQAMSDDNDKIFEKLEKLNPEKVFNQAKKVFNANVKENNLERAWQIGEKYLTKKELASIAFDYAKLALKNDDAPKAYSCLRYLEDKSQDYKKLMELLIRRVRNILEKSTKKDEVVDTAGDVLRTTHPKYPAEFIDSDLFEKAICKLYQYRERNIKENKKGEYQFYYDNLDPNKILLFSYPIENQKLKDALAQKAKDTVMYFIERHIEDKALDWGIKFADKGFIDLEKDCTDLVESKSSLRRRN